MAVGFRHGIGNAERVFADAPHVFTETFRVQRYAGVPLETRGVVAQWDRRDGTLTTWNSTQVSHFVQQGLAGALELPPHRIRVIAPDLGGGFGTKASGYAEDLLVPAAAMVLGRPVKWIESRREHMMGAAHARHQTHQISLAARRDGTILAVRDHIWLDLGAYNVWGIVLPYNTVAHLLGPHRVRDLTVEVEGVVTHKTPNAPYRGAGRPETVFAMDRAVDGLAARARHRSGRDPASQLPDRGRSAVGSRHAVPRRQPARVRHRRLPGRARRRAGGRRLRGVPRRAGGTAGARDLARHRHLGLRGGHRHRSVRGRARHARPGRPRRWSPPARCARARATRRRSPRSPPTPSTCRSSWITVIGGDTAAVPFGVGTFASRSGVTAGSSIFDAAHAVRAKVVRAAAALLEAAEDDIEIADGQVSVRGATGHPRCRWRA